MKRSGLVRFQVLLLVSLAALLVWRASSGPELPETAVGLADLEDGRLYSVPFEIASDGRVRIDATGSLERSGADELAAYPWILDGADRSVAWMPRVDSVRPGGTLFSAIDTLALAAGRYLGWFTTLGPGKRSRTSRGFLGLRHHWTSDRRDWRLVISPVDSVGLRIADSVTDQSDAVNRVWATGPMGNGTTREAWITVDSPVQVRIRAVGEVCDGGCDTAVVEDVATGRAVWTLASSETGPAGGAEENRAFDGELELESGIYLVRFQTDGSHAYGSWEANPPWDPEAWGMSIGAASDKVRRFDPWETSNPVVEMLAVGDDETRGTVVEVLRPVRVAVDAMGEIWDGGQRYDYAWIEREDRSRLWEMTWERTIPGGGDRSNRREVAFLDLTPGRYAVYYQSDHAHAYGNWSRRRPDHPERWGVAVFSLESGAPDSSAIRIIESKSGVPSGLEPDLPPPPPVPTPIPPVAGEVLFDATRLRNDVDTTGVFELSRATRVRIVALGEISRQGSHDFGWLESEDGDYVWEMTLGNTKPAGGDDSFRRFDAVITLPAGRYRARFHTDFSNAYGDFGESAPRDAADWGMRIVRMPE